MGCKIFILVILVRSPFQSKELPILKSVIENVKYMAWWPNPHNESPFFYCLVDVFSQTVKP